MKDERVLLGQRHPDRRWYPDCWDLIGGHVEPGESPEQAMRHECREEVGIDLVAVRPMRTEIFDPHVEPHGFVVSDWRGEPSNTAPEEHDDLAWFGLDALAGLRFPPPDVIRLGCSSDHLV